MTSSARAEELDPAARIDSKLFNCNDGNICASPFAMVNYKYSSRSFINTQIWLYQ